jgi:hypothetical protein
MADRPVNEAPYRLIDDVAFGENVVVFPFANLYGCEIGENTRIGPFVEIQQSLGSAPTADPEPRSSAAASRSKTRSSSVTALSSSTTSRASAATENV